MWSLLLAAYGMTPDDIPNPRAQQAWVADAAEVIPDEAEARMNARISALHQATDAEVAVVTAREIPDEARAFATQLFERWGVGDAAADNGLVMLLVVDQRRLSMVTGYGLEPVLPDGWLGAMQTRAMVPHLKEGDLAGGLEAGLAEIDQRLRGHAEETQAGTRSAPTSRVTGDASYEIRPTRRSSGALPFVGVGLLLGLVGFVVALALRPRRCKKCREKMGKLDEVAEEKHLTAGQNREDELGSVRYTVWVCPACQETEIETNRPWASSYDPCKGCGYRTAQTTRRTLEEATTTSTGVDQTESRCVHCHHTELERIVTPMVVLPVVADTSSGSSSSGYSSFDSGSSSGGSDSGGSFGGGDTGGGGADSSY